MSTIRKVLIGIVFLGFVGLAGYGLYYFFFKPPSQVTPPTTNTNTQPAGNLPVSGGANNNIPYVPPETGTGTLNPASPIAKGGPTVSTTLVSTPTLGTILSPDGKSVRYYDRSTGKFMTIDSNGNLVELSAETFPSAQNVTWAGDGNKAVVEFPDSSKIIFNFSTQKQTTIPASWEDFSFSPQSDKLAAKQESDSSSSRYLVVSNSDGTGVKPIAALGNNGDMVDVTWSPSGDVIAMSQTGDTDMAGSFGEKQVLFIGQNGENFPATVVDGLGFIPLWSPNGNYLLYSSSASADDFRPRLYVVLGSGANRGSSRRALNIMTFADKCSFADSTIAYCAVPDSLPDGIGLERGALGNVPDSIYKINVSSGLVTLIGRPQTDTMIRSVTVSGDGSTLFFTDANNGSIKKMMLK